MQLCHNFFVRGSIVSVDYGAALVIQFNDMRQSSVDIEERRAARKYIWRLVLSLSVTSVDAEHGRAAPQASHS